VDETLRARQRGFTYIGLLIMVAIMSAGLAYAGIVWETAAKREREAQLLFVGEQYRRAIGSYYESSPGGAKQYPARLEDLLDDGRHPTTRRHLRRLFRDPITGSAEWGLVRGGERVIGVYSRSGDAPLKKANFKRAGEEFSAAASYTGWRFVYAPSEADVTTTTAGGAVAGGSTGSVAAPGNPAPEPVPADVTPPPPTPTPRAEPDRKICDQIRRTDAGTCSILRVQKRDETAARCEEQARARYDACLAGSPLPAFNLGR
jgi:type II secretory pathway pseudopilin PulG